MQALRTEMSLRRNVVMAITSIIIAFVTLFLINYADAQVRPPGGSGGSTRGTSTDGGSSGSTRGGSSTGGVTTGGGTRGSGSTGSGSGNGGTGTRPESEWKNPTGINLGSVPVPSAAAISAGIPKCPESIHDSRTWHGLYEPEYGPVINQQTGERAGCHYTHEHHHNPHDLDSVLGTDAYYWFGGQNIDGTNPGYAEISYPWQTFKGASYYHEDPSSKPFDDFENQFKHVGNKVLVKDDANCQTVGAVDYCVDKWRLNYHAMFSEHGAATTIHSMFLEAKLTEEDGGGVFKSGGWIDFGPLETPLHVYRFELPNDHPYYDLIPVEAEQPPYRGHCVLDNTLPGLAGAEDSGCNESWNSEGVGEAVVPKTSPYRIGRGFAVHVEDGYELLDPTKSMAENMMDPWHYCIDNPKFSNGTDIYDCEFNASHALPFRLWIEIPRELDGSPYDTNPTRSVVTVHGFTNRYGDLVIDGSCGEWNSNPALLNVGLDCVPLVLENIPTDRDISWLGGAGNGDEDKYEFDIAPIGEYWIGAKN